MQFLHFHYHFKFVSSMFSQFLIFYFEITSLRIDWWIILATLLINLWRDHCQWISFISSVQLLIFWALVLAYLILCKFECCYFYFLTLFSSSKARKWESYAPIKSFILRSIVLNPDNAIVLSLLTLWSCTYWLKLKSAMLSLICLSFSNEYKYRNWIASMKEKLH